MASRRNSPAKEPAVAAAWAAHAAELARWTEAQLVNHTERWKEYLPMDQRTATSSVVTRVGKLTRAILVRHYIGQDVSHLIRLPYISANNTSRWIVIDIDHHSQRDEISHANHQVATALYDRVHGLGFQPLLLCTNDHGGYRLVTLFSEPVPAPNAIAFAHWLVGEWRMTLLRDSHLGSPPERRAKAIANMHCSSCLRLPGRHHNLHHYSALWTGDYWAVGEAAIRLILQTTGQPFELVPTEARDQRRNPYDLDPDFDLEILSAPNDPDLETLPAAPEKLPALSPIDRRRPIDGVLARLANVQPSGTEWSARCPVHHDRTNSLSIREKEGQILLHCHVGCAFAAVLDALKLTRRDLFAQGARRRRRWRW